MSDLGVGTIACDTRVNRVVTIKGATKRQTNIVNGHAATVAVEYTVYYERDGHAVEERNVPAAVLVATA